MWKVIFWILWLSCQPPTPFNPPNIAPLHLKIFLFRELRRGLADSVSGSLLHFDHLESTPSIHSTQFHSTPSKLCHPSCPACPWGLLLWIRALGICFRYWTIDDTCPRSACYAFPDLFGVLFRFLLSYLPIHDTTTHTAKDEISSPPLPCPFSRSIYRWVLAVRFDGLRPRRVGGRVVLLAILKLATRFLTRVTFFAFLVSCRGLSFVRLRALFARSSKFPAPNPAFLLADLCRYLIIGFASPNQYKYPMSVLVRYQLCWIFRSILRLDSFPWIALISNH